MRIVGKHPIHAREIERNVIADGHRSDAELGASAHRNEREFFGGSETQYLRNLVGVLRTHHHGRKNSANFTRAQIRFIERDVPAAGDLFEASQGGLRGSVHEGVATERGTGGTRISPQALPMGRTFPGLSRPAGLNAARTRSISARSSGVKIRGMSSFFSMPIPCSPVSAPPTSTQWRMISPPAATTRANCARSRSSNRMSGCRLPSPA